jgi:hypothetical protein
VDIVVMTVAPLVIAGLVPVGPFAFRTLTATRGNVHPTSKPRKRSLKARKS